MKSYKLGILGVGKMGGAILNGILTNKVFAKEEILLSVRREEQKNELEKEGYVATVDTDRLLKECEIILLSVKPQMLFNIIKESDAECVISIAAGIKLSKLEPYFPKATIVRAMPNTPAMIGEAVTTVCCKNTDSDYFKTAIKIFEGIGSAYVVDESLMDSSLPLNGSMPAYLYYFAKCFIDKAVEDGIDYETARKLTADSIKASADMILKSEDSIEQLITNVCSKKGTTIEGLCKLSEGGFKPSIDACFEACRDRSIELSK